MSLEIIIILITLCLFYLTLIFGTITAFMMQHYLRYTFLAITICFAIVGLALVFKIGL